MDRLTEAKPEKALQDIGLPDEAYTYDAIGNRLGSRHQPGQFEYNQQDQLVKWGANAQLEALTYTATGQVKQKKKITETIDYNYDATDRLTQVKRDDTEVAAYQYDPFGRRLSKRVNGELTYYLYSDEGLIAELNEQGKLQVAYGWEPNAMWGTSPLWQANIKAGQTLKNADYHYLHTDHIGTPQIATNQAGEITWQAVAEAFGETQLNPDNQITMNLRFPEQYFDAETGTHYNYFRDYNPQTGRYQQSDPIGLGGGINFYGYVHGNPLIYYDPTGEAIPIIAIWIIRGLITGVIIDEVVNQIKKPFCNTENCTEYELPHEIRDRAVAATLGGAIEYNYGMYGPSLKKSDIGRTKAVGGTTRQPTPYTSIHSELTLQNKGLTRTENKAARNKGRSMIKKRIPYIGALLTIYELVTFFDC